MLESYIEIGRFEYFYNLSRHHICLLFHTLNLPAKEGSFLTRFLLLIRGQLRAQDLRNYDKQRQIGGFESLS